jgi:hypothetical protein
MSRTYRCRKLPKFPGTAKKLLDGTAGGLVGRMRTRIESEAQHKLAALNFHGRWTALNVLERQVLLPAAGKGWHPWLGLSVYYSKKHHRVPGNRRVRHKERNLLQKWAQLGDDFEAALPGKLDGWDWWDVV